jgi:uncharacterized protein YicC (UPF0701 family)
MIVSMTGFGDATAERDGTHYAVEIRSLNNRFFKPVIKLPENLSGLEPELETVLREKLGRGSITYILKMRTDSAEAAYHINTQRCRPISNSFSRSKGWIGLVQIDLASLCNCPASARSRAMNGRNRRHGETIRELTAQGIDKLAKNARPRGKTNR